jgi:HEAT repeat protein
MAQTSVVVVSLAMLGALGGLAYVHANREDATSAETLSPAISTITEPASSPAQTAPVVARPKEPEAAPAQPASARQITIDDVARWIADTRSNDAKTRAIAIDALANAPKAQAIPALERVLESGEPQTDRQIALQSLHTLALKDGDNNGRIRDAIRHAMYHSEDEGVTQSAQALLEDIEAEFAGR